MALCQKSEIGPEIERSDTSSDRVCHACVRKTGRGGTPLYGLYRYVPRDRVWFFEVLDP